MPRRPNVYSARLSAIHRIRNPASSTPNRFIDRLFDLAA
jgi:hypothetical protein